MREGERVQTQGEEEKKFSRLLIKLRAQCAAQSHKPKIMT